MSIESYKFSALMFVTDCFNCQIERVEPCAFVDLLSVFFSEFRKNIVHLSFQNMDSLSEMLQFLDINARLDLKAVSVTHVLSTT